MNSILEKIWDTLETLPKYNYKTEFISSIFPSVLHNTKYIPKKIQQYIIQKYKSCIKITLSFKKVAFTLYIHGSKKDTSHLLENIDIIITTLQCLETHCVLYIPKSINIYIYLTHFKKIFPKNNFVMKPIHVNTGVTELNSNIRNIIIFRKEEWYKVFIHEICHALSFDKQISNTYSIRNLFNIYNHLNYNEAYTEFWATILLCVFTSYYNSDTCTKYIQLCIEHIENEIEFSLIQANNVLNHMFLHYNTLIEEQKHTKNVTMLHDLYFKEETNVFCYYVLKVVLLFFYEPFLNLCNINNKNIFTVDNETFIIHFIHEYYRNKYFIDSLYDFSHNKSHENGLRMTNLYLI